MTTRNVFFLVFSLVQFSLLFCHKDVQKTRKSKYLKSSWRGSPRKATRLIRNGLAQLNYYNKMISELYIQTSKAELQ